MTYPYFKIFILDNVFMNYKITTPFFVYKTLTDTKMET